MLPFSNLLCRARQLPASLRLNQEKKNRAALNAPALRPLAGRARIRGGGEAVAGHTHTHTHRERQTDRQTDRRTIFPPPMEPIAARTARGAALVFWQALVTGDGCALLGCLAEPGSGLGANSVFDISDSDEWRQYRSNARQLRLWSLTYEQELTTPLHITASRGYLDCLRHLLLRGAEVDLAPGGQTALHAACAAGAADCVRLLLSFGADPAAVSDGGFQPLHLCRSPGSSECARLLLSHGAPVNGASEEEGDTPLHVAARLGLPELVGLFLQHGADLEATNGEGETPLIAACSPAHSARAAEAHFDVCRQLVEAGARVNAADRDRQRPLHQASKNANARVVALLLARGANVNIMSYSGNTALHNALQVAAYRLEHQPELTVRHLLNHGAVRVWPGALLKVLRHCCASPRTVETLLNCYARVPVTEAWQQAVPEELVRHPGFFRSLFALGQGPRSLQHLARCALRSCLEGRLLQALPHLRLPPALEQFVLLRFEDLLY
ncbi:ankyrin repeat and SOCS box protein 10 isoform X2 [Crotalus tigris]|uniref:ankyrin repeat and SOCS box protein 10 isoform X2 n=1 Tax=Crotalus tigris TaxID=88082 RepID=UPI00192FB238|nr:ankyrin repeat and SOCS box protein 10 isoform X2 [Crotalus tigris]